MLLMTTIIPSFLAILGLLDILKIHVTRINPLAIGTIIVLIFVTILVVNLKYFLDERRYQNNKLLPRKVLFIYLFVTFLLFVAGTLSYIAWRMNIREKKIVFSPQAHIPNTCCTLTHDHFTYLIGHNGVLTFTLRCPTRTVNFIGLSRFLQTVSSHQDDTGNVEIGTSPLRSTRKQ